jgi:hypothetical protein
MVLALAACGALLVAAACGDDDDTSTNETTTAGDTGDDTTGGDEGTDDEGTDDEATDDGEESMGDTVDVVGVEFAYEGLPDTVEAGTSFSFSNEGEELHEMVVFQIPEGEDRSVEELLQLSEEELGEAFGGEPEPVFVSMAEPGGEGLVVFPEGAEATVTEPGRYAAVCFIPVGTTEMPEGEMEGPPEGEGPPHFTQGMHAEFTVE